MECDTPKYTLRADKEVREAFDKLGDPTECKDSAITILKYMTSLTIQQSKAESTDDSANNAPKVDLPEDASYILQRLARGVLSTRNQCHQGYYLVIESLLKTLPQLGPALYSVFQKCVGKSIKIERGSYENGKLGSILFYGGVIRSGLWKEYPEFLKIALINFNNLMRDNRYYEPIIGQFCIDLLNMSDESLGPISLYEVFKDNLDLPIGKLSIGNLWIRIVLCNEKYYKHLDNAATNFREELFLKENFSVLFQKLSELNHFNMSTVLGDYFISLVSFLGKENGSKRVVSFFKETVLPELPLFPEKNRNRIFLYTVVAGIIPHLSRQKDISSVFCHILMTEFLVKKNHSVPEISDSFQNIIKALSEKIKSHKSEEDGVIQISIIKSIIEPPMSVLFDNISKSKFLYNSIEHLNPNAVQLFTQILFEKIENDKYEVEKIVNGIAPYSGDFIAAALLISRILTHSSMAHSTFSHWRTEQITHLAINIFFRNHPTKEAIMLRDVFRKCFEYNSNKFEERIDYTDVIIENIFNYANNRNHCLKPDDVSHCWNSVYKSRSIVKKDSRSAGLEGQVFRLLYNEMCLNSLFDVAKTRAMIVDLDDCYQRMLSKEVPAVQKMEYEDLSVIVDLLLALLSKADHHWRKNIVMIFRNLCLRIEPSNLTLITDIVDPLKQDDLFSFENDAEEDAMDVNDDEVDDKVTEEDEDDDVDDEDDDDDDDQSSSEDENDDSGASNDDEDITANDKEQLKLLKLKERMQSLIGVVGDEDVDMDSVPQEELDALNTNIGALMKSYVSVKRKPKRRKIKLAKDETEIMHFRIRVCDLLEIVIKVSPSLKHLAQLIDPLLRCVVNNSQNKLMQPLNKRIESILSDLTSVKKFATEDPNAAEFVVEKLNSLFQSYKNHNSVSNEIGYCCTFLFRSGLVMSHEKSQKKLIISEYSKQLLDLLTKQSYLLHTAFAGPLALDSSASFLPVMKTLTNCSFGAKSKSFGQIQAATLLVIFLKNEKCISKLRFTKIKKYLNVFSASVIKFLDSLDHEKKVKVALLISYFDVIKAVKELHVEDVEEVFDWDGLKTSLSNLNDRIDISKLKSLRNAVRAIAEVLKIPLQIKSQSAANKETAKNHDDGDEKHVSNKKKNKLIKNAKKRKTKEQIGSEKKMIKIENKKTNDENGTTRKSQKSNNKKERRMKKKEKMWAKQIDDREMDEVSFGSFVDA